MDGLGAAGLIVFAALLAFNQVVIKVTGGGFGPVFQAGLRSLGAMVIVLLWIAIRRKPMAISRAAFWWGVVSGLFFAAEFLCIYTALDMTTVSRASILFYSMPVWLALAAHFLLPGERLSGQRAIGLALAMGGVILALADRSNGAASLTGDLLALGAALGWGSIALLVRLTPLASVSPVMQLFLQLAVSTPILLAAAPWFGDLVRAPEPRHYAGLAFQTIGIASIGYLVWFEMMKIYRASSIASFSFLSPVLAVVMGWAMLGEHIGVLVWLALGLVAAGVFLINRR